MIRNLSRLRVAGVGRGSNWSSLNSRTDRDAVADRRIRSRQGVVTLRDCPVPESLRECDTPQKAADYWRLHVANAPTFNPDVEAFVVLHLNTRRRDRGHHVVATGTLDTVITHNREVFRTATIAASAAVVLVHNHPSGDSTQSEADMRVTRDLIRAGQILKIEVLDHVIVGAGRHTSLRELGLFYH